jgi:hypothetical protein
MSNVAISVRKRTPNAGLGIDEDRAPTIDKALYARNAPAVAVVAARAPDGPGEPRAAQPTYGAGPGTPMNGSAGITGLPTGIAESEKTQRKG